ncbi:MAG: hypothetical protein WA081_18250 [Desulfosalsimonadaceae bacterium]
MNKSKNLKKQIDTLPSAMLVEVERFIKELKNGVKTTERQNSLLSKLAACAIEDDLPSDLAEQHDHYLYGTTKI